MTEHKTRERVLDAVVLVGLIPIAALAMLRVLHIETSKLVLDTQAFTQYLVIPLTVLALIALIGQRKVVSVLTIGFLILQLVFVLPELTGADAIPASAKTAPHLRLFTHNVKWDNSTPSKIADGIRRENPDVIFLQEVSYPVLLSLKNSGVLSAYPNRLLSKELGTPGIGIWSKTPLEQPEELGTRWFPALRATVKVGDQSVRLYNVHILAPSKDPGIWRDGLRQLRSRMRSETIPVLAAGDFNSVFGHREYRNLLGGGFRDAHVDRGRGFADSWPVNGPIGRALDGVLRIDHVVTGPGVRATSIKEGTGDGSDHRSVTVDLAIIGR